MRNPDPFYAQIVSQSQMVQLYLSLKWAPRETSTVVKRHAGTVEYKSNDNITWNIKIRHFLKGKIKEKKWEGKIAKTNN
jgi:hypothetical protein